MSCFSFASAKLVHFFESAKYFQKKLRKIAIRISGLYLCSKIFEANRSMLNIMIACVKILMSFAR